MFSATAIADFLACRHLTALNRAYAEGEIKKPFFADPGLELLKKLGLAHEQAYLTHLTEQGLTIIEIPTDCSRREAATRTVEAIRGGAEVIYQASFLDDQWYGRADFLIRVHRPSKLGSFCYEVVETKLARSTKARAIIQLCFYSDLLSEIQGAVPEFMHVVLGGERHRRSFWYVIILHTSEKSGEILKPVMRRTRRHIPSQLNIAESAIGSLFVTSAGMMTIIFP